jgi:hypothetical protein
MGEQQNQPFQLSFAHITATLSPPVITRCCYSVVRATVSRRSCSRATCIVRGLMAMPRSVAITSISS